MHACRVGLGGRGHGGRSPPRGWWVGVRLCPIQTPELVEGVWFGQSRGGMAIGSQYLSLLLCACVRAHARERFYIETLVVIGLSLRCRWEIPRRYYCTAFLSLEDVIE